MSQAWPDWCGPPRTTNPVKQCREPLNNEQACCSIPMSSKRPQSRKAESPVEDLRRFAIADTASYEWKSMAADGAYLKAHPSSASLTCGGLYKVGQCSGRVTAACIERMQP